MTPKPKTPGGNGDGTPGKPNGGDGSGKPDKPSQVSGKHDASKGVTPAHDAIETDLTAGQPAGGGQGTTQPKGEGETGTTQRDPKEPPDGVTFPDPKRPNLGSDGKYYIRDGDHDVPIDEPGNLARTITDIDKPQDGTLWEEKSATNAGDVNKWVNKQVVNKMEAYIEARQHIAGYENAPIGIEFTTPGADPAFRAAVDKAIADLRVKHPGVEINVKWAQ
jgi:hypothetical protein